MNLNHTIVSTLALAAISGITSIASADLPEAHTWPMSHIMVSMEGNTLHAHVGTSADNPILMQRFLGESYDGNASALNDQYYSDQYGWALDGLVDPGFGNSIWIEMTEQSDGLATYEGGRRMMIGEQSFDSILGTDGSAINWQWSGMMMHNWYAAGELGDYEASYRVYVGDSSGNAVTGYADTNVTLNLRAVPAPSGLALLGMGTMIASRRKRA
tara:strand:+ start:43887 stop:44528 length:642 start_codon:yes stop_codon:yes gene_type:complete